MKPATARVTNPTNEVQLGTNKAIVDSLFPMVAEIQTS